MEENFFVKTVEGTSTAKLTAEQKTKLNRRGNELFNEGNIEMAARIFTTTEYLDGLNRIGDYYYGLNKKLYALKYYKLAKNQNNVKILIEELANLVRVMIKSDE